MAKRTGYLGANLHQGTGLRLWEALNEESRHYADHTVFVLPGGRLNYRKADEHLRNSIFRYVNSDNFDGAVVWGSTLAGEVGWKDVGEWTKELGEKIPVVSLGIDVEGVPSITYDAYTGVYRMVEHFITVHGYRRIAFLRGPENHDSAYSRYEAYRDCLRDHGIEYNPLLVSSPHTWNEGENAIREIGEKNHMLPRRDYDAVIASSDIMAYLASRWLEEQGYLIPDDIALAGFNDSPEAFLCSTELTTVRLPVKDMVEQSFRMIRDMENNPDGAYPSRAVPTVEVYRRSCGCKESYGSEDMAKEIADYSQFENWINLRMGHGENATVFLEITSSIFVKGEKVDINTRRIFSELCWRYLRHGGTMKFFFSALKLCRRFFPQRTLSMDEMDILHEVMMENVVKINATDSYRTREINNSHNSFTNTLLKVHSYMELSEAMKSFFPSMGIEKAFVFTYTDDGLSRLESGFSGEKLFSEGMPFSSQLLFPEELSYEIQRGLFVVEPLYYDNKVDGYIILKNRDCPASMIENIRTDISSGMQAIDLYFLACEKSQKAEEAEKQSSDFYAHITEELRDPLDHIKKVLEAKKSFDGDELLSTIVKTEHLLELSAVEKGGITLEEKFTPLRDLLTLIKAKGIEVLSPYPLPSVVFDRKSVEEIASCLLTYFGKDITLSVKLSPENVILHFYGESFSRVPSSTPTLQYVEKLLLMQGGTFSFSRDGLDVLIPYPSLSGEKTACGGKGGVVFISDDESTLPKSIDGPVAFMSYDDVIVQMNSISSYTSIAWDAKKVSKQSGIAMNLLRNHKEARLMPFLCFGLDDESISVAAAIEGTIPSEGKGCIYSFGPFPETLSILREFAPVEEVKSLSDIPEGAQSPLFIFNDVDTALIEAVRKDRRFTKTPVLIVRDRFEMDDIESLSSTPNVLIVNTSITEAEGFINRIVAVFGGEELLPPLTSILVKKAICYLNDNATYSISRWQIAGSVNISEDYLTRIFRKEIGISPWDYLNRYRIQIASRLLLETGSSISEIASLTGFQDQAYFCRVFRKVKGFPPGNIRTRQTV
jgi:DNA-binding LacI/PurR family transcriptional regulator/AraC-like DNA-binding protein